MTILKERLSKIRKEQRVSIETIIQALGLKTKAAYYKKENGTTRFTLVEAKILSRLFNKSIEEIFFDD
ncbi:helix-turn-helix transcriptional regulator [Wukongibacter baidiensis]|uniref:helix-turn-helix transcriptional regulator n=1 Tax=Wukongibacter baidiensis TaxID=1723361 RepID=UPI003D7F91E5